MEAPPRSITAIGKAKSMASVTRGVGVVFLALLPLVLFTSSRLIDDVTTLLPPPTTSETPSSRALKSTSRITLNCGNQTTPPKCPQTPPPPPPPSPASPASHCPLYFRWMYEDLRPWKAIGITRETLDSARQFATFRLVVLGGRVYVDKYRPAFQTRDLFTLWGILQLVSRYPGRVPDLDLMFDCDDTPVVRAAAFRSSSPPPPPVFRYCKNDETLGIVFPDWSFWGWPETNIRGWERMVEELKKGNERVGWKKREAYAYWKGNPFVSDSRRELISCNVSQQQDWNARLFAQDWDSEIRQGFRNSNMANQCDYRYKIYVEGRAWSVSQKYILACNSPALFVTPHFHDFFSRTLMPGVHYWPINEHSVCKSIKFAVDWGNHNQEQAEAMGRAGSRFVQEELKMEYVYDYMLHLLIQYAKLLRYQPSVPEKSTELCLDAMACAATGLTKELFMESMEKTTRDAGPCRMPRPFTAEELRETAEKKANAARQVELWEQEASG